MTSSRRPARWLVVALALLAGSALLVGVWAQFFPRGFYTSFPSVGGRWIAVDGPYNEHLVRDVGGLNFALAVVTIVALMHRTAVLVRTAALAWLVYSVPHFVYHSAHLDLYDDPDIVLMIVSLAMAAVLPAWLFLDADRLTAASAPRAS
jgi:heme A synthase